MDPSNPNQWNTEADEAMPWQPPFFVAHQQNAAHSNPDQGQQPMPMPWPQVPTTTGLVGGATPQVFEYARYWPYAHTGQEEFDKGNNYDGDLPSGYVNFDDPSSSTANNTTTDARTEKGAECLPQPMLSTLVQPSTLMTASTPVSAASGTAPTVSDPVAAYFNFKPNLTIEKQNSATIGEATATPTAPNRIRKRPYLKPFEAVSGRGRGICQLVKK